MQMAAAGNAAEDAQMFGIPVSPYFGMLRICAWCKRIPLGLDLWVGIDEAEDLLPVFNLAMLEEATHGVCPDCYRAFLSSAKIAV